MEITNKYALRIRIANTFEPLIRRLQAERGGSIYVIRPGRKGQLHHKVGYSWAASGETARTFLMEVSPFLIIKPEQARIDSQIIPHRRGVKITESEQRERTRWREELRILNRRGTRWQETGF